jgi:hypothetical protein
MVVDDLRPAQWPTESIRSFAQTVGSRIPATFGAYARVLHPAHDGGEPVSWAKIARANRKVVHPQMQFSRLIGYGSRYSPGYRDTQPGVFDEAPAVGTLPPDTAASLARALSRHSTAGDCWFAVWDGWGDLDQAFGGRPAFRLPGRNYHLARGPIGAATRSVAVNPARHLSATLWWPDDHAWCVAIDIDLDSTYVGASQPCIRELLANPELEVVPLGLSAGITADSDASLPDGPR